MSQLTHINAAGEAHMVDVSGKAETVREARAEAYVEMQATTLAMIIDGSHHKGDVFATARIADPCGQTHLGADPAVSSADAQQSGSQSAGAAGT